MPKKAKAKVKAPPLGGDIIAAMDGAFADWFQGPSWDRWRAILKGAYALPMTNEELRYFREIAERDPPTNRVRELWVVGGRRGGKDSVASLIIAHTAALFDGRRRRIGGVTLPAMRRGERATVFCFGPNRDTARIVLGYISAYFQEIPELKAMITRDTRDGFELENGVDVVVATSDFRGVRGRAVLCAILDETAMLRDETSARPDTELYAALTPGMLTLKDQAILIGISTPMTKTGLLWEKFSKHYARNDPDVLVVKATSLQLNPLLDAATIEAEIAADPAKKRAEYLCEWREGISNFIASDIIDAAIIKGRTVLPPHRDQSYFGFCDVSGGVNDAHTLAIAYREDDGTAVLACAREIKSSNTEAVVAEFGSLLQSYGLDVVHADRYGQHWVMDAFARHEIELKHSEYDRSQLYLNLIPALSAGQVRMLDLPRLRSQFLALERRILRTSGKEIVDHPTSGSDDLANSVAGALVMAATAHRKRLQWSMASLPGTRNGETGASRSFDECLAAIDADEPALSDPLYERAMHMRRGVRINGQPLPWAEIMKRVRDAVS